MRWPGHRGKGADCQDRVADIHAQSGATVAHEFVPLHCEERWAKGSFAFHWHASGTDTFSPNPVAIKTWDSLADDDGRRRFTGSIAVRLRPFSGRLVTIYTETPARELLISGVLAPPLAANRPSTHAT
jgi:hypothetical protein